MRNRIFKCSTYLCLTLVVSKHEEGAQVKFNACTPLLVLNSNVFGLNIRGNGDHFLSRFCGDREVGRLDFHHLPGPVFEPLLEWGEG